ncbi:MAG: efflux RND transporter periplasmic adaptor subunit [Thermoanaerobaculia bacterium]|nr:efflux RND transporter periplasmic adaptor subunit [Thermoanaerobaculia bacterium]
MRLAVGITVVGIIALLALRSWIRPSLDREEIRTAIVERGEVVASISAAGVVVPMEEQVVSALFPSEVMAVIAGVGSTVETGQPILGLDGRQLELELADLEEQLALKENLRRGERLALQESLGGLQSRHELLAIDLKSRQARLNRFETLARDGAVSKDQLFEAQLDVTRTSVEMQQLERSMVHAEAAADTQLERIDLETSILRHQVTERRRQLETATVTAPRDGVVTWLLDEVGTRVVPGMALVRVADLSTFRVEAQVSDFYASRLEPGLPAVVRVGEDRLDAEVAAILPTIEGGQITLQIDLADPQSDLLRSRLRVDVEVVTGRVADALSLKNGPAIGSNVSQTIFKIADGVARRTDVVLGISSRHRVQVLEGLEEGDEVIISDPRHIEHLESIRVK